MVNFNEIYHFFPGGGPTFSRGVQLLIPYRNPLTSDFKGGGEGPDPLSPPLDPHLGLKVTPPTHYAHLDHESLMIMTMSFILSNFMAMQIKDTWIMSRTFVQFLSFKRMTGHRMLGRLPQGH